MDNKMALYHERCFPNVQNLGEISYFRRFQESYATYDN